MSGADEFTRLADDLGRASREVAVALYRVYENEGQHFSVAWKANARATAGKHGKYYPDSITSEMRLALGVEVEVGPDSSLPQGKMGRGFELGSVNQPPHLDGLRAMPAAETSLARSADEAVAELLP